MSINWTRIETLDKFSASDIANAVRSAVELPPEASFNDFMHVLHEEERLTDNIFKKKLLGYCIAVWYFKLMRSGDEKLVNELASIVAKSWKEFIDCSENIPSD